VFPDLIARNQSSRQLRIWSAGCSTGAEPYSVSILLRRDLAPRVAGWDITIVGTDINREFLARAREGRFEDWALRSSPDELKRDCFTRSGRSWLLKPEFEEGVSFQYHNLVTHPFPSLLNNLFAFDLILCRNVTIYFSLDIVRRIIGHFHHTLVEGGWLLVGHSEPNMELFRDFRTVNAPGAVLYQKSQAASTFPTWTPAPIPTIPPPTSSPGPVSGFVPTWQPPKLDWGIAQESGARDQESEVRGQKSEVRSQTPTFFQPPAPAAPSPALANIRSLADRGEWEQAAQCCRQVLEKDKLNPAVHFLQALILEQTGRHAEAENSLRRALYLDRNFVLAHYYLGLLLQRLGQLPQAARSFQNVLQLLARLDPGKVFADGDGITAGELTKLTQMHLKVLEGA
jgi:chemotaxis protein methyltransferase CheR